MPELCTLQLRLPKGSCLPELGIVLQVLASIRSPVCNDALHTLSLAAMVILILLIAASVHCPAEIPLKERERDSSVVRAPDSCLKGRGFESLLERRESFPLHGQLSVLTLISVSVPPP